MPVPEELIIIFFFAQYFLEIAKLYLTATREIAKFEISTHSSSGVIASHYTGTFAIRNFQISSKSSQFSVLDAIASLSTYPCQ